MKTISIWAVFRRGKRWYIETRDGRQTIDARLSAQLNAAGRGYPTRARAEAALQAWLDGE